MLDLGSFLRSATVVLALLHNVDAAPKLYVPGNLGSTMFANKPLSKLNSRAVNFDYNGDKIRGVNLGGWFVLEPWITPSIFQEWETSHEVVDEFTFSATLGPDETFSRLSQHWNTWITQDDFNQIAQAGLNHVRIPVGYWALAPREGDPYVQGQLDVLDRTINWAREAGLKIMMDLHGAPGSQNGFDNSGKIGDVGWQQGNTVEETLTALENLANRYENATDVVTAIELLNEPLGQSLDLNQVAQFYNDGYGRVKAASSDYAVVFSDAFQEPFTYWNDFGQGNADLVIDTHQYQIFSPEEVGYSPEQHIAEACVLGPQMVEANKPIFVGEWCGALTDCTKWLNGLGKGARYDGTYPESNYTGSCEGKYTGTVDGLSEDDKFNVRTFIEAQLDSFEQASGWVWWTWKTESSPEWDMQALIAGGLFPQPLNDRQYPGQCNQ